MDFDGVKKFFSLFLAALGIFVLIFIAYTMVIVSRIAQDKKKKQDIKKSYADEYVSPRISPTKLP